MTPIAQRPADVAARLVPGHWEGDLILGQARSATGTLVERTTRFLLLVLMPTRKADVAASAFAGTLNAVPAPLRRTLTYDQGKEMARHKDLAQARGTQATGMRVFFADPHSPWRRGSNENTNGLLRQYFPKGMSLASLTQADLDTIATSLNTRPRKTLGFDTPHERFTHLLATLPPTITRRAMVGQAKLRWRIERDYQDLKRELGLGRHEGRGWRGFHHHATLCIAAYGFLVAERGAFPSQPGSGRHPSKHLAYPTVTDPAALPIRPERHVIASMTTLRTTVARALARTLPRCPCCQRQITDQVLVTR